MAFNPDAAVAAFNPAAGANRRQRTVLGYVNMYLPKAAGGRAKFGAVALHAEVPNEAKLFEMLKSGKATPEAMAKAIQFEFNEVNNAATIDENAFAL